MKIELDEKSIKTLIKYTKNNPKEILELMEQFADQALEILMKKEILERGAQLYKMIKKEIVGPVTHHKCPQCRYHPLKKIKNKLTCPECGWSE